MFFLIMIDLTRHLSCVNFSERLYNVVSWLITNIGPMKFDKLGHTQGHGWLLISKTDTEYSYYEYKLYFDEPNDELMFKLACL